MTVRQMVTAQYAERYNRHRTPFFNKFIGGHHYEQSSSAAPQWPYGKEEIDFVHFLDACVIYCEHAAENPELTATYAKLRGIFCHIDHARQLVMKVTE